MLDLQPIPQSGKNFTVSLAAWLLAFFNDESMWQEAYLQNFKAGIEQSCQQYHLTPPNPPLTQTKKDPRCEQIKEVQKPAVIKVYTDYDLCKALPFNSPYFEFVEDQTQADFLLIFKQVKDFLNIPIHQKICQFPYESCLIRKDLLPLTVRQYCSKNGKTPNWWLPCFDLSTEFHLFAEEYKNREADSLPNQWIIKPAQGTRAKGHRIIENNAPNGLQRAAIASPALSDSILMQMAQVDSMPALAEVVNSQLLYNYDGDRVAQLFVDEPLLVLNRKFDMRFFVLVRSFVPFEAYTPILCYSRLANKPYQKDRLQDPEIALTVCAYDEDEDVANKQERVFHSNMQVELDNQYGPGKANFKQMLDDTHNLFRELFQGAANSIGIWPNSRAYYSVDIIYDASPMKDGLNPAVKIVECNFLGDWNGVEEAVKPDREQLYEWADDLITVLATDQDITNHPRFVKL